MAILVQNLAYVAQIVNEGMNHAIVGVGYVNFDGKKLEEHNYLET